MIKEEDKGKGPLEKKDASNNNGNAEITASQSLKMDVGNDPNKKVTTENSARTRKPSKGDSMGMIFMCNAKTKQDCFRYQILGMPGSKREMVAKIYKGMRLFLFDIDLRLLYGIYKAAGPGSYNIEAKAFNSAFPSQVRFTVLEDCNPLAEEKFKVAIKDNYFGKNKFDSMLKPEQVKNLCKLFTTAGTKSKQVIGVTEARSYVDRAIDRVSRPAFSGDNLLPKESGLYERDTFATSVLPSQPPPTLPTAYSYDQPLGTGYHRTDTSHGDHNRWILDMEIRRQEESKKRDSNNVYREYPAYPDPLYAVDLPPSYPPPVDLQPGYPPMNLEQKYPPPLELQSGYPPPPVNLQSLDLQSGYPPPPVNLQSGYPSSLSQQQSYPSSLSQQQSYPSSLSQQQSYPSSLSQQQSYPPSVGLQSSYSHPVDLQSSYPPVNLQSGYPPSLGLQQSYPPTLPSSSLPPPPPLYRY